VTREEVERVLSIPVLIAALLVIPVIVIEQSATSGALVTLANVLNWLIWIVFAVELVALLAVTPNRSRAAVAYEAMGFRFTRRKSIGRGFWVGVSKRGVSGGRRGRRLSTSVGRQGPRASVRLLRGLSYVFTGKR
jgi:hypothetical protein